MGLFQEIVDRLSSETCDEQVEKMRSGVRSLFLALAVKRVETHRQQVLDEFEERRREYQALEFARRLQQR